MLQPVPSRVTEGRAALTTDERRDAHFADLSLAVKHARERHAAELVRLARSPKPANARICDMDPAAPQSNEGADREAGVRNRAEGLDARSSSYRWSG
jgi:hypothetical protein